MVRVRNIYYMLSYAYSELKKDAYRLCGEESFENIYDLLSAILVLGVRSQLRKGLARSYNEVTEEMRSVRGRLEIKGMMKMKALHKGLALCSHDEFSPDEHKNRIIKATLLFLLKRDIPDARKRGIKVILPYFQEVSDIDLLTADFAARYGRSDETYRMMMGICRLIRNGLIQNHEGKVEALDFIDGKAMCALYEKFILEYYRKEWKGILTANAKEIPWDAVGEDLSSLPAMRSDITLEYRDRILVIDAKYYGKIYQKRYEKKTWHSGNLYQIFTYVKNKSIEKSDKTVSGMLLYAGTDEDVKEARYNMSGNDIAVGVLDLDSDFSSIREYLDHIALALIQSSHEKEKYGTLTCMIPLLEKDGLVTESDLIYEIGRISMNIADATRYIDVLREYGIEWSTRGFLSADTQTMDEREAIFLLIALYRADHMCEGVFEQFIRNGTVLKWLKRLRILVS